MTRRLWFALALFVLAVGCRAIAGYRDLSYEPPANGVCAPLALPTSGAGRVRLANVGTAGAAADFCIRASGTSDWGSPVFYDSGGSCASGLAYATATIPFAVPAGAIDVAAVPVGSGCNSAPTSSVASVTVGDTAKGEPVVTLVRIGGTTTAERIVALPEETNPATGFADLRFVNAIDGTQSIIVGAAPSLSLPTTVPFSDLPVPIAPGGVEPAAATAPIGAVDGAGYAGVIGQASIGVAFAGQTNALFAFAAPNANGIQTIYAIGRAGDATRPLRGLFCDESGATVDAGAGPAAPFLQRCVLSPLPNLAVDIAEVALYGAFAPFESVRQQPIYSAIAARTSDIVCVTDVNRDSDKAGVADASADAFPYSFYPNPPTDLDSQPLPSEATEIDGAAPPAPPSSPPCTGVDPSAIDAFYSCLATSCTQTGDMSGYVSTTNCAVRECTYQGTQIYKRGPQENLCWDCIIYHMVSEETLAYGEMECTEDARAPYSFNGATSSMILSRYPLADEQAIVLPGSGFRKALLYAEVQLEDQAIDFYCADLVSSTIDTDLPYTGSYGQDSVTTFPDGGQIIENGWQDEKDNQAKKVIAFIQANSQKTQHRAIIAGYWDSSPAVAAPDGGVLLGALSPEIIDWLDAAFTRGEPAGYTAVCDDCPSPTNVYNGAQVPQQTVMTYLLGFDPGSVSEDSLWGTANTVVLPTNLPYQTPPAPDGPISPTFPRLFRVLRPNP